MAGTIIGGRKARDKNLAKNPDFYSLIGKIGGSRSTTGGFASKLVDSNGLTGRERARLAGSKGGTISRRNLRNASRQS